MWGRFIFLLLLLAVCSVGPGFFLARKLPWSPPEKLCAALGLSLLVLYLSSFVIFALHLPQSAYFGVSALCLALLALSFRDLTGLFGHRRVRRQIAAFAFLFLWAIGLLSLVRHYSGGLWAGDWIEHYERTLFFLDHQPKDTVFIGAYLLPARPPLMNLVAAHFLAQVGRQYDLYQVVFLFLNLLIVFPCFLIAGAMAPRGGGRLTLVAGALAASPMLLQNVTWTWTKLAAGFYVILAIWLYLRGWRKQDPLRMTLAFVTLSAGLLVHYSVGPYALFLALHYLIVAFRTRTARWRELAGISLFSVGLLATWLAWSTAVYGPRATFGSNTTVTDASKVSASANLVRAGTNLVNTIIPHPFRPEGRRSFEAWFTQRSSFGYLRDYTFLIYQVNLIFALGSVGGLLALYRLYLNYRSPSVASRRDRNFWSLFVLILSIVGIAAVSEKNEWGLAHICLQPLVLMGVVLVAATLPTLPPSLRVLALTGYVVDFALGILLHFNAENRIFQLVPGPGGEKMVLNTAGLSSQSAVNWGAKEIRGWVFWGDHFVGLATPIQASLVLVFALLLHHMVRQAMAGRGVPRSAARAATGSSHRGATAADTRRPRRSARENPRRRP